MNDCKQEQNEGKDLQTLYQAHWNNRISCVANRKQSLRQLNKSPEIPRTEDLLTLKRLSRWNWRKVLENNLQTNRHVRAQMRIVHTDLFY